MTLYLFYRLGHAISLSLPVKVSYRIACFLADIHYRLSTKDRNAVLGNLRKILGGTCREKELAAIARDVFRNFAKYLVDFFRFSKLDMEYLERHVKIEGLENIEKGLSKGKGVIALSAHMGNWELGACALSMSGYPLSAVTLTHQNKKINDFFTRQRMFGKVRPIEIGISLRNCYTVLKDNGLLALLADRDFSKNGLEIEFFGMRALIPKGPSAFSCRIGSAIVPIFMIREPDDTFRLIAEKPIFPDPDAAGDEEEAIRSLTGRYLPVIESYIKRYPAQWYVFKDIWNGNGKEMRPDTVL